MMNMQNFEVGEHIDCLDTYDKWLNAEVVQKRNGQIKVHYSGFAFKYDEWLPLDSPRLLKQWKRGQHLQLNNRVDVQDTRGQWLEARVINFEGQELIRVHYKGYAPKFDETLEIDSDRISEVGSYSQGYGWARYHSQYNRPLRVKRQQQEEQQNFPRKQQQENLAESEAEQKRQQELQLLWKGREERFRRKL